MSAIATLARTSSAQHTPVAISGLSYAPYASLFSLTDAELEARGMRRYFAPENPAIGYPCRVSLAFAKPGEELLLVNYRHLDKPGTPYRSEGPIFIRRNAVAFAKADAYPEIIMQREMSVRAYDAAGFMLEGELAEKEGLKALVDTWFARADVAHVDIHSARRGCFFCRIERA
ncbi:MAG: hypothetical protein FD175_194 [Beijerinckiaceae bacterium]|nr:MAG: hypothetical protein FD175_194 [Beijerinckiaceae bacterium]